MRAAQFLFLVILTCWPFGLFAAADTKSHPVCLGESGRWTSFQYRENGQDVCYMLQRPAKSGMKRAKGDATPRADTLFMISLRPSETVGPIVSFEAGYLFKAGSEAKITIDGARYGLFTDKGSAWARTAGIDHTITTALLKGKAMVVQGQSAKGSLSADQFDLKGAMRAYKTIAKACGIRP